jgi:predicted alpha/beta hydrolase family esterase
MAETTAQKQVLFIQGGGDNGYEADAKLAESLRAKLGTAYNVHYPQMIGDEKLPDFGWGQQIDQALAAIHDKVILVGHSVGASILLKHLSENEVSHPINGIFLIATPFWGADYEGLMLRENFADTLPKNVPIFLYHTQDDEEVSITHLSKYAKKLPQATIREIASGGHQLGNDLTPVALDIKNLK